MVLLIIWWGAGRREVLVRAMLMTAVAAVAVTPWLIRNHQQMGSAVMSTNVGDNLCIGNGPDATGHFRLGADCATEHDYIRDSRSEVLHDEEATAIATAEMRRVPLRQATLVPARLWATVVDDHDGLRAAESFGHDEWMPDALRTALRWFSDIYWFAISLVAVVSTLGWMRRLRNWRPWRWGPRIEAADAAVFACLVGVVTALAAPVISFGEPRFKIPAIPFLALLVAALAVEARRDTEETIDDSAGDRAAGTSADSRVGDVAHRR